MLQMTEEQKYLFDLQGYIVLKDVVSPETVAKVNGRLDELESCEADALPHGVSHMHFVRVVKAAFNQRRKTLRNSIKSGGFDATRIPDPFQGQRAEQLSVAEFLELAAALQD